MGYEGKILGEKTQFTDPPPKKEKNIEDNLQNISFHCSKSQIKLSRLQNLKGSPGRKLYRKSYKEISSVALRCRCRRHIGEFLGPKISPPDWRVLGP